MKTRASSHFGCEEPFCHGVRKVALKGKETKDTSGISVTTLLDFYFFLWARKKRDRDLGSFYLAEKYRI